MDRDPMLPLGLATLLLAGCGGGSDPAAVQAGEAAAVDPVEHALARQIVEIQDDIAALQRRKDGAPATDAAAG